HAPRSGARRDRRGIRRAVPFRRGRRRAEPRLARRLCPPGRDAGARARSAHQLPRGYRTVGSPTAGARGRGDPVMATWLCLHGFTGTPECFRVLQAARPQDTLLAPMLTGHGSPPLALETSFTAELTRLQRWLGERWQGPTYLLGYSLGARLALGLLVASPERFQGAVLVGVNPGLRSSEERRQRQQADRELRQLLLERGVPAFVDHWQRLPL